MFPSELRFLPVTGLSSLKFLLGKASAAPSLRYQRYPWLRFPLDSVAMEAAMLINMSNWWRLPISSATGVTEHWSSANKWSALLVAGFLSWFPSFAGDTATAEADVIGGLVSGIMVTSSGSGYVSAPAVTIDGGGGYGATAKAFLKGDKVAAIIVVTAGSGYTSPPLVTVEEPPKVLATRLEMIPKLTVDGPAWSTTRVEWGPTLDGPWVVWTNLVLGAESVVLVDLTAGSKARFYRSVPESPPGASGFVWIPPGTFVMGSAPGEEIYFSPIGAYEKQHTVVLTKGFWISNHEVTQGEYVEVMGQRINPSLSNLGLNRPVTSVSYADASEYCRRLTDRERLAGRITGQWAYRLPTEAEWEYSARAGSTEVRYGDLNLIAWHLGNSSFATHSVNLKAPNAWGLYDTLGNVAEWCSDYFERYPEGIVTDPSGPIVGGERVIRGGYYRLDGYYCRAASRMHADMASDLIGFRPVLGMIN